MSILSYFTRRDFEDETVRKKYGFTLAEILITLVIIGFIASLGIPMLGQQKIKKPNQVKIRHGTFECYYDQEGTLHSYYVDSEERPDGVEDGHRSDDGSSCQFTPPSDSNVMIYAIGAGGTGAMGLSGTPSYQYIPIETSGYVKTDTDFQLSLTEACKEHSWVCEYWDKQWDSPAAKQVKYTITSPLGSGGVDTEERRLKNFDDEKTKEECQDECAAWHPSCSENCFEVRRAEGGKGGQGGRYTIKVKLMSSDSVGYTINLDKTRIDFNGNKYIELKRSGNGGDGSFVAGTPRPGRDGEGYPPLPNLQYHHDYMEWGGSGSGMSITASYNIDGNDRLPLGATKSVTKGSIGWVSPLTIKYEAKESGILANFGLAGTAGSTNFRVYETLPSSIMFRLNPARTSSSNSEVKIIRNGSEELLFSASSGENNRAHFEHLAINKDDRVFPSKYKADDFTEQIPAFSASHGVGYKSKLAELQASSGWFMPGKSGAGAYPVLFGTYQNNEPFRINNVVVTNGGEAVSYELPGKCFDGSFLKYKDGQYYCGEHENLGNPGAIVIKW